MGPAAAYTQRISTAMHDGPPRLRSRFSCAHLCLRGPPMRDICRIGTRGRSRQLMLATESCMDRPTPAAGP